MMESSTALRYQVLKVYKELLFLGRAYPLGYEVFRKKLHTAFRNQSDLTRDEDIIRGIEKAKYAKKEIEALYYLKKYRTLKKRYNQ